MESKDNALVENCTIAKVSVNGNFNDPHYLVGFWGDVVKVILIHKDEYWKGKLAPETFSNFYEKLNMSKEQYAINTKRALTTNSKDNEFSFEFAHSKLVIKKAEIEIGITLRHGIVDMKEHFKEGGNTLLIDTLLDMKELSDKKLKHQESESEELEIHLRSVIDKCEEFSKLKQVMEEDLYVKFMALLNNKKEHVAKMEEFINGVRGDPSKMESKDNALVENCTIAKVSVNGNFNDPHYLVGFWGDVVKVILIHKDEYWKGKLAPETFSNFYEKLNMSKEQYAINTKRALTTNSKDNEFSFEFADSKLVIKKAEIEIGITLRHGIVDMKEHFKEGGNTLLIDTLLDMKELSDKKLKHQESESEELEIHLRSVIDKCEEFSKLKQVMEEDLYVKFMALLNNKKEHVAKMEEFINGVRGDTKIFKKVPALQSTPRPVHAMSDSE